MVVVGVVRRAGQNSKRIVRAVLERAGLAPYVLPPYRAVRRGCGRLLGLDRPTPIPHPQRLLVEAAGAAQADRPHDAIALYNRCLEIDSTNPHAHLGRALRQQELGNHHAALLDAYRYYALAGSEGAQSMQLHQLLARALAGVGDFERAISHQFQHLWLNRYGKAHAAVLEGEVPPRDALGLQTWIECHDELAAEMLNRHSDFESAVALYRQKERYKRQFVRSFPVANPRALFLPDDWVRNIGHLAVLDFWVKQAKLGYRPSDQLILLAPDKVTANPCLLDYWRAYFTVVSDPHLIECLRPFAAALGNLVAGMLDLPDGTDRYFCEGMGAIQEEWERQGRAPLLSLGAEDRAHGRIVLQELGVPADAWFATLHVRTGAFHKEGGDTQNVVRNADVRSYLSAIREVTRRGGWVVRLGDPSMPSLPPEPGLIDYAHAPLKSPRMDIFLIGASRFFIGVGSGLSQVPTPFGVPCAITNWVSNALPVFGKRDLFLPKLHWSKAENRYLRFAECLAAEVRALDYSGTKMAEHGLSVVDNTPEELREVVAEMMDHLEGKARYSDEDRKCQAAFRQLAVGHGLIGFPRMGRDFLRRHADLLAGGVGPQTRGNRSGRGVGSPLVA